jgi:hypothetical protein
MKKIFTIVVMLLCLQAAGQLKLVVRIEWPLQLNDNPWISLTQYNNGQFDYPLFSMDGDYLINETTINNFNPSENVNFVYTYNDMYGSQREEETIYDRNSGYSALFEQTLYSISTPTGTISVWAHVEPQDKPQITLMEGSPTCTYIGFNDATYEALLREGIGVAGGYQWLVEYQTGEPSALWNTVDIGSSPRFNYRDELSLANHFGPLRFRVRSHDGVHNGKFLTSEPSTNPIEVTILPPPPTISHLLIKHPCAGGDKGYVAFALGDNVYAGNRLRVRWASGEVAKEVTETLPNGSTNVPTLWLNSPAFAVGAHQWQLSFEGQTCTTTVSGEVRTLPATTGATEAPCSNGSSEVYSFK